jgi:hypothetical protein
MSWKEAWVLGKGFSNDEQSCKMQGKSEYKTRCGKFKRLGDGIQTDAMADDDYAAYSLPKPVLVHGVLRKSGRGCPPSVLQEDKTGKAAEATRGTVKAAVLKGDSMSSDLVVASCYDQKPFYMISSK